MIVPADREAIAKALQVTNPDYQQAMVFEREVAIHLEREQQAKFDSPTPTPAPRI